MTCKNESFDIASVIPVGSGNAVSRKWLCSVTAMSDRQVRKAIEMSDQPITNLGYGYFIPDMNNDNDRNEASVYYAQERARIRSLEEKLQRKFSNFEELVR